MLSDNVSGEKLILKSGMQLSLLIVHVTTLRHVNVNDTRERKGIEGATGELKSGKCECCGRETDKLNLDHDHVTGKIRGWLCRSCNLALGHVKDDVTHLRCLIAYLTKIG